MIEYRLSRDVEVGASKRPRYATDIMQTDGGHEYRNERWRYPLFQFEVTLEPGDPNEDGSTLKEMIDLFHAAGGAGNTFLFRDWTDNEAVNSNIATADGSTTTFQLYKSYQRGNVQRQRKITRPVDGTETFYIDGVPQLATLNADTGVFVFPAAPTAGAAITADFEFNLPVRFANDELELIALSTNLDQPVNVTLLEVRE